MMPSSSIIPSRFPIYLLLACSAWLLVGCGGGGGGTSGTPPAAASTLGIDLARNETTQSSPTANDECEHTGYSDNEPAHDGFWYRISNWFHDDDSDRSGYHDDDRDHDRDSKHDDDDHDRDDHEDHENRGRDDDGHQGGCTGAPTPAQNADLVVTKSVDNANPNEGDTVVFTVTVSNNGPLDATGVSLNDVLPTGLSYVSDDAGSTGTSYSSGTGVWTVGGLVNAASATLHLTAMVDAGTGGSTLTSTASVAALDQTDPVPGNNSAAVDVTVVVPATGADLAVTNSVDNASPGEGDNVVFTLTVTNNGPSDATGVSLSDVLPAGLTYVSDDAGSTGTSYSSGTGVWTVGGLANAATATLRLTALVDAGTGGTTLTNTASVAASDQTDPNATNDSAAVGVSVTAASGPVVGLLDYWRLDETSGSSYTNEVGGSPSASCSSCPTPVAGRIGGGQQFDGTSNELNVADDSTFDWSNGARFSIEAWIKRSAPCSVTGETAVGRQDVATQLSWSLGCQGSNATFRLVDTTGAGAGADLVGSSDIADGNWHHVVAMRDAISGTNLLYVDGVEEASAAVSYSGGFGGTTSLNIGWLNASGSDYHFAGTIDEVALHDRVLPDSEIRRHYADGTVGLQRGYEGCGVVRIMPLGDSITRRWGPGYREGLYFDLIGAGMNVDMVGSMTDSCDPNCSHDPNNEGHSGFTPTDIAGNVVTWLNLNPPDVVTLHIGTNVDPSFPYPDVTQVGAILDAIKGYDPAIPVVLARIINKARSSYDPQLSVFNQNLEMLAQARIAAGDRILVVDQEPGLDYSASSVDFDVGDDLHPTAGGFAKMVPVWFEGLNRFMPACNNVSPQVISPALTGATSGGSYDFVVEATGVPAPAFSLATAPSGMTIHPDTGRITWTAGSPGNYDVTVQVTNTEGTTTYGYTLVVAEAPVVADGDINGDGQVNAADVLLAVRIVMGQYTPTAAEFERGNVAPLSGGVPMPDAEMNAGDVLVIQRKAVGLINF